MMLIYKGEFKNKKKIRWNICSAINIDVLWDIINGRKCMLTFLLFKFVLI